MFFGKVTISDLGIITSFTWVSFNAKTPSRIFFSSGFKPVTLSVSIRVSNSPADKPEFKESHLLFKLNKPKLISTFHGLYSKPFYSQVMSKVDHAIAISDVVKDYIKKN